MKPACLIAWMLATGAATAAPTHLPAVATPPCGVVQVAIEMSYDRTGTVTGVSVLRSSGVPELDAAAVKSAMHWRVKPATQNGRRVAGKASTVVNIDRSKTPACRAHPAAVAG